MTDRFFQAETLTSIRHKSPILPCSASGVPRGPRRALWCHRLLPPCLSSPSRARALAGPTCRPRRHPSRLRRISPPWPLMEALQPSKEYYKVAMVGLYKSLSTKKVKPSLIRLPWTRSLCVAPLKELGCSSEGLPLVSARRHERKFRVPHLARGRNIFNNPQVNATYATRSMNAFDINCPFLTFLSVCYDFYQHLRANIR